MVQGFRRSPASESATRFAVSDIYLKTVSSVSSPFQFDRAPRLFLVASAPFVWQKDAIAKRVSHKHNGVMDRSSFFRLAKCLSICAAGLLVSGCDEMQQVGSHEYDVPDRNLIPKSSYPFFLPRTDHSGFIFILNPDAPLPDQNSVLVEDRRSICARAQGLQTDINSTICAPQEIEWQNRPWIKRGDDTWWTYNLKAESGALAPLIRCSKMQIPGHSGLCHATLKHGDLSISIGLRDDEISELESKFSQVISDLKAWER